MQDSTTAAAMSLGGVLAGWGCCGFFAGGWIYFRGCFFPVSRWFGSLLVFAVIVVVGFVRFLGYMGVFLVC